MYEMKRRMLAFTYYIHDTRHTSTGIHPSGPAFVVPAELHSFLFCFFVRRCFVRFAQWIMCIHNLKIFYRYQPDRTVSTHIPHIARTNKDAGKKSQTHSYKYVRSFASVSVVTLCKLSSLRFQIGMCTLTLHFSISKEKQRIQKMTANDMGGGYVVHQLSYTTC